MSRAGLTGFVAAVALVAVALTQCGCEKSEQQKKIEEMAAAAAMPEITTEQRAEAQEAVDRARAKVKGNVAKVYKPAKSDLPFYLDLAVLTSQPHRLAGFGSVEEESAGSLWASKYVENRLLAMGIEEVTTQTFPVIQPVTTECQIVIDGQSHRIYAVRPNLLQASVTPEEGITGQTIYVGRGALTEYGNRSAEDKIVVMDFDSEQNWQNAFACGARAVLFVAGDKPAKHAYHHINLPANLPRFYVPRELAEKLELTTKPQEVKLLAACEWREYRGRNVIGIIRGTDPEYSPSRGDQAIVLAAPLDTLSEVPAFSPGARDAANCAALLSAAALLKDNAPRRDIILCFFDAQAQNHMGARAFYGGMYRRYSGQKIAEVTLEGRLTRLAKERKHWTDTAAIVDRTEPLARLWKAWARLDARIAELNQQKQAIEAGDTTEDAAGLVAELADLAGQLQVIDGKLAEPDMAKLDLFSSEAIAMPGHDKAIRFLREEAKNFDSDVLDELRPMRLARTALAQKKRVADKLVEQYRGEIDQLKGQPGQDADADVSEELTSRQRALAEQEKLASKLDESIAALNVDIDVFEERDLGWNAVIRDLYEEKLSSEARGRLARLMGDARKVLDRRLTELSQLTDQANQALVLRNTCGVDRNTISLHIGMNLGDARDDWTFIHGDNSIPLEEDKVSNYTPVFRAMRAVGTEGADEFTKFDMRAVSEVYENRMFCPAVYSDSTSVARLFAILNVSVMTSLDRMVRQGLPGDTLSALDVGAFSRQVNQVLPFIRKLADHRSLDLSQTSRAVAVSKESDWQVGKANGPSIKQAGAGSAMPDRAVRDAIVALVRPPKSGNEWKASDIEETPPGFVVPIRVKTDTNGVFEVPVYYGQLYRSMRVFVATFDRTPVGSGEVAESFKSRGLISSVINRLKFTKKAAEDFVKFAGHLFKTKGVTIVGYGYNRGAIKTIAMRAMSTAKFRTDRHLLCEYGNILTLYAPYDAKGLKLFNKTGAVLLNNTATKQAYQGKGLSLNDPFYHPMVMRQGAHDLAVLNSYRLKTLRTGRINHQSLEKLNGEASDLRSDAQQARQVEGDRPGEMAVATDKDVGDDAASAALSRRTYIPLVGVMNDLVTAVVLLLLLAIPFAYALERLLVGTPHIYRQIGWFGVFFMATFIILFLVNPAFKIAATPTIIFLAFSIILLASLVIFILMRKLQTELKKMQGLGTTVHSADVSRLSTMSAAVNMGVSTMRRRPVRTLLTAITVVLLTFTILTFASFGSSWGIRETYQGAMTGSPQRMLVRHQLWSPIEPSVYEMVRGHLQGSADVVPRYWVAPTAQQAKEINENTRDNMSFLAASADLKQLCVIDSAIGLDSRDIAKQPHLAELFSKTADDGTVSPTARVDLLDEGGIILTDAVRERLGLTEQDIGKAEVVVRGRRLAYAGVVSDRMVGFTLLDGTSMLPVDYQASVGSDIKTFGQESATESLSEMPDVESAQFISYNIDQVVIVSADTARSMNGKVRSVTVYPHGGQDIRAMSRRVSKITEMPSYVGDSNGVTRMIFTSLAEASGAKDLLIPVLLGGMIIFATMLGSVSDREREIYTFSSLGLAPAHVASLFFAEAGVYAVVGGMGGYLLGQVVAHVLGYAAALGWVSVPAMNYSSTNAIVTILIVMGTVLISTIYPAMKASRSANPGIQRAWQIPPPVENLYDILFPFTVSTYDIIGVVSFLKEHFDNYTDTSLGVFTSLGCNTFRQEGNDMLGFRATVALAPFDLGVTQEFALLSRPSDIEGIDEMRILIYRLSGARGDWRRSNRVFINELRRQLLIWRSLSDDVMDRYRQSTLDAWDQLPVQQVDETTIGDQV